MTTLRELLKRVPVGQRPMALDPARADTGRIDELGNPVLRDLLGREYTFDVGQGPREQPAPRMPRLETTLDAQGRATHNRVPDEMPRGVGGVNAIAQAIAQGLTAPRRAAQGDSMTLGDVWATALDYGGITSPMRAPAGALRSGGFRAYHGSPHDFDRFSMDKIGTGEGAQAYGHGLYFAENEAVARGYRDALSTFDPYGSRRPNIAMVDGRPAREIGQDVWEVADQIASGGHKDVDGLISHLRKRLAETANPSRATVWEDLLNQAERVAPDIRGKEVRFDGGRMYEVNINANPEDFLDWDAPLSAQPGSVRRFAEDAGIAEQAPEWRFNGFDGGYFRRTENGVKRVGELRHLGGDKYRARVGKEEIGIFSSPETARAAIDRALESRGGAATALQMRGSDVYDRLVGGVDSLVHDAPRRPEATQQMRDAGIPGIRYKDAGSRGTDSAGGTRNFVVFDENLIEIVRKYGVAGAAAMLGMSASQVEAAMNGQQPQQRPLGAILSQQDPETQQRKLREYLEGIQ